MSLRAQVGISVEGPLHRGLLVVGLAAGALTSAFAFLLLGPVVGVKSTYVLLGVGIAAVTYSYYDSDPPLVTVGRIGHGSKHVYAKAVLVVALAAVAAVASARHVAGVDPTTIRALALLVGLPVGYTLVVLGIRRGRSPRLLLPQIVALFAVPPVTKIIATTFYLGKGDTPKHLYYVDLLVSNGTWQAIPLGTFYHHFPGLHSALGTIRLLTGLPSYDAFMTLGIVVYAAVVCLAYLFARLLLGDRTVALFVALAASLLAPIHTYSTYLYPQAFAVPMVLLLVYLAVRHELTAPAGLVAHTVLSGLLVVVLWFSHHLTVVLFAPILLGLVVGPPVLERVGWPDSRPDIQRVLRPRALPLVVWVTGSVLYWTTQGLFIEPFLGSVSTLLAGPVLAGSSSTPVGVTGLGVSLPDASVTSAVVSLGSPSGIYNILLVCVLTLGVLAVVGRAARYRPAGGFLLVGVLGSILLLRTPVAVSGLDRIQLPLAVFVAFVVGIGIERVLTVNVRSLRRLAPGLVVVLLLSSSVAVVTGHDLAGLHSGPDLWENRSLPDGQKEFSTSEMRSFEQSAAFFETYDTRPATDWRSDIGLGRYGVEADSIRVESDHVTMRNELLLYRDRWTAYSLRVIPERLSMRTVIVGESWMDRFVATENKVYTTGEFGMLADREDGSMLRRA